MRFFNPVICALLRSPLHRLLSRQVLLLSYTGRKSGRRCTLPVGSVRDGDALLVVCQQAELKRWWRNLRGGAPVAVLVRGHALNGRAEVIEEPTAVAAAVEWLIMRLGAKEAGRQLYMGFDVARPPTQAQLAQALKNVVLVRITPEGTGAVAVGASDSHPARPHMSLGRLRGRHRQSLASACKAAPAMSAPRRPSKLMERNSRSAVSTHEPDPRGQLSGQVALVTGAGRGIGRAIALALSQAGAALAVCARSEDQVMAVAREIALRKGNALGLQCDVLDRHQVEQTVARVEATISPVDLLVNNAGQFGPIGPVAATDPDEWWQTLEVNLRGPLYCTRAVLPGMLSRGHGRIVNISSSSGLAVVPMLSAYAVSKAALYRLTENLAAETR